MKVFVISNNCFANNNSNGRMMSCLFRNIKAEDVFQFYIVNGENDFEVCANYYLISDRDIIKRKGHGALGHIITENSELITKQTKSEYRGKVGRNSLTMLIRYLLWKVRSEKVFNSVMNWVSSRRIDIVLLQAGDAPFMYEIGVKVAKELNLPLVIFNTEFFYFEKLNWVNGSHKGPLFYSFRWLFIRSFKKAMLTAKMSIHNSEWIQGVFDNEFKTPSTFIYQSSDIHNSAYIQSGFKRLVYVGNLSFCRHRPIIEIARELSIIDNTYYIEVYGPGSDDVINELKKTDNIRYCGVVSYEVVKKVIQDCTLLLVVESQDPINSKLTEYGFSTKITDYMGTGIPILAYGASKNVGIDYLYKNNSAFVVNNKKNLNKTLDDAISNEQRRTSIVKNALEMSEKNHRSESNSNRFYEILNKVLQDSK